MSENTKVAYATDIRQFLEYFRETNVAIRSVAHVTRSDVIEYLSYLSEQGRSGVTRARKLAAITEFFKFLIVCGTIPSSPVEGLGIPKKERKHRVYLRPEEYSRMLAASGANPRDFAILTLFLQTGIRASELANLLLSHIDLQAKTLTIESGKGQKDRVIDLEKKGLQAISSYLNRRPTVSDQHVFLNYQNQGLSRRSIHDIVQKYVELAGIQKHISAHSLRHTFATQKARQGISAFQLQKWLGHSSIQTTQIYVHMGEDARKQMEATSL